MFLCGADTVYIKKGVFFLKEKLMFMKKSVILFAVTLCLSLMFGGVGFAQTHDEIVKSQLDELADQYNVKFEDPVTVPDGVTPLEFDSIKDLEKALVEHQEYVEKQKALFDEAKSSSEDVDLSDPVSIESLQDGYQVKGQWLHYTLVPPVKLNIGVEYTYSGNTFYQCTNVDSWTTGLDFPIGYGWEQTMSDDDLIDGARTLAVQVSGIVKYYVVIDDIGQIITYNHSQYEEFYL